MDARKLFYLFILGSAQNFCKGCDWIQAEHGFWRVSGESLSLINEMGGEMTDDKVPVPFPRTLYRRIQKAQMDDKVKFLQTSIDQIIKLFHGNLDAVTWNKLKVEHFLTLLDRQSRELQKCVSSPSKNEKRLNRYFRKLKKNVLKQRKYDAHSWELIRKEVRRHLQRLDLISAAMKTPAN
ncbi:interferon a3-like [Conger conger]|uniref:interferon a3-like n=1 Tax=Conger conger TaxID=82655 RepID=UPI002A5A8FB4|nr:interferon a3-like [Conger conger]